MALHCRVRRRDAEPLWDAQTQPVEERRGGLVRAGDAAESEFAWRLVSGGEHDVMALQTREFFENGARAVPEARALLPFLKGLPHHVGEKAHEDVGVDAAFFVMPNRSDT